MQRGHSFLDGAPRVMVCSQADRSDACATSHDPRAHDVLMDLIFPRMSRVRTTDQVVRMIREARGR